MSRHKYTSASEGPQDGCFSYEFRNINGEKKDFFNLKIKGLPISERIGWDTYLWPDRFTLDASVKLFYDSERDSLVVKVKPLYPHNDVPKALDCLLREKGFFRLTESQVKRETLKARRTN